MRTWSRLWIVLVVLGLISVPVAADTDWSHFSAGWIYVTTDYTTATGQLVTHRGAFRVLPNFEKRQVEITDYEAGVRIILSTDDTFRFIDGLRHLAETPQGNQRHDRGQQWYAFTWTDAAGAVHGWLEFNVFEPLEPGNDAAVAGMTVYELYLPVEAMPSWIKALENARGALLE